MVETLKPARYDKHMSKLENYITVSEFASQSGVSVQAIHKAMKQQRIKDYKRMGSVYVIARAEIAKYKAKQKG